MSRSHTWFRRTTAIPLLATLAALAACAQDRRTSAGFGSIDSLGVRILRGNDGSLRSLPVWHVDTSPLFRVGVGDQIGDVLLFRVTGAQRLTDGRVVIASDAAKRLFFVDTVGDLTFAVGRLGRGPGEFQSLRLIPQTTHDTVAVYDPLQRRLTLVASDGSLGGVQRVRGNDLGVLHPVYRFGDGSLLAWIASPLPEPTNEGVVRDSARVVRVSPAGELMVDFGWHLADDRILRVSPSGGLTGGDPPFPRQLLIAATDSAVFIASTGRLFEVRTYGVAGRVRRVLRIVREGQRVTQTMIDAIRQDAMRHVTDAYTKREWTRNVADDVFPERLPVIDAMVTDEMGALWVRDHRVPGAADALWTVIGRHGIPIARARIPADVMPTDITADRLLGVRKDADDFETVVLLQIVRAANSDHVL